MVDILKIIVILQFFFIIFLIIDIDSIFEKSISENRLENEHENENVNVNVNENVNENLYNISIKHLTTFDREKLSIYYLHIHKSGGSMICGIAVENNLTNGIHNCNADKKFQNYIKGTREQQRTVKEYYEKTLSFISNEKELSDNVDWSLYSYMTTIRHPFNRAYSHYNHVNSVYKLIDIPFQKWVLNQPDNLLVRLFCGTSCNDVPQGNLTENHFRRALDNLQKFDVVLILENISESMKIVNYVYQINKTDPELHRGIDRGTQAALEEILESDPEFAHRLHLHYSLDLVFYDYARYINSQLLQQLEKQEINDVYKNCYNSCCGRCSRH